MVGTPCCEKVGLNKGLWSAEEDEILRSYIQANGEGSWKSLPKNAGLKRCGKSCRLRWVNYLKGDLMRGNITSEEDDIIIKMHSKIGNRWSVIAGHLPGRTDNEIKNYWNSYLSRRIYTIKRPLGESSSPTSVMVDIVKLGGGCTRKARTTRTAKKKNNTNPQEIPSNAENVFVEKSHIQSENAGGILNSNDEEIEIISRSSSLFANGEPDENEILGPYHGLDQSSMFTDDDIMSDDLLSDILSIYEKDNGINTMSEGGSGGGVSLVSNGAAEKSVEWTNTDREGVLDGFNHKLLTSEGGDELFSWLWDDIDCGNEEDMFGSCEEQIKAIADSLLS